MSHSKISAFIITLNEECNMAFCLEKLSFCDEIIVLDSGSTDRTVEISMKYGAKVTVRPFDGFGSQKNYALSLCQHPWRLSIDADEILDDELIESVKAVLALNYEQASAGYFIKRRQIFMNKPFNYGDESARKILRLVKYHAYFTDVKVHEELKIEGSKKVLEGVLAHNSYASFSHYLNTVNKYTSYNAEKANLKGKYYSTLEVLLKPRFQFFRKYILNLNFLNGIEGYYWSKLSAYYVLIKCLKVREYAKKTKKITLNENNQN